MAQIVGVVAAQVALDEADKMLQNQGQNQSQSQSSSSTDDQDDQSLFLSAPSGAISSLDPTQLASSLLPDNFDSLFQANGSGGGQSPVESVIDKGEDILDQGVSMGMSFMGK
ncbi:hypothetical protein [Legionella parisiensis]|nr:hypothetical protein [Legionella parisiensis]KTD43046.1 hypothetical protein Lpar_1023 [Legionella parisiensis]STX77875.1 Uncharacterised protein [Legionella parisiensis]